MSLRASILALLVVLASSTARADAVGPPTPITCPVGAREGTSHCGTQCHPAVCDSDADCREGETCVERPLCAEDVTCGGWGATATIVHGACASGSCAEGTCRSIRTCGPRTASGDAGSGRREHATWGCGCRGARTAASLDWGLPIAMVLSCLLARRRARRAKR
ncbi:MAG TPA: hypothetical protein VIL20_10920 [Sandaracinaceae bacterium]